MAKRRTYYKLTHTHNKSKVKNKCGYIPLIKNLPSKPSSLSRLYSTWEHNIHRTLTNGLFLTSLHSLHKALASSTQIFSTYSWTLDITGTIAGVVVVTYRCRGLNATPLPPDASIKDQSLNTAKAHNAYTL